MISQLYRRIKIQIFSGVSVILIGLTLVSCLKASESSNKNESILLQKINAVQEQIMAQGNMTEQESQALLSLCNIVTQSDGLANYSPDDRMVLRDVDRAPVFVGCEALNKEETMDCFSIKVQSFVQNEFNLSLSQDLNLSEPEQVEAFFIIDETGKLTGMKVRDSEVTIQAEILRILRNMPVMGPAIHNGKNASVLCSMLVTYGNDIGVEIVYIPEFPESN